MRWRLTPLVLVSSVGLGVGVCCSGDDQSSEASATSGGTGASAGGSGASGTAATSSAGSSGGVGSDCRGAILCEDFEGHAVGQEPGAPWVTSTDRAAVDVSTTRAVSGSRSVHFLTEGGAGSYRRAYISVQGAPHFPLAGNVVWGRMKIWLNEVPPGSVHWTNIQGEGDVPGQSYRSLYRYGGMHDGKLMANYETEGVASDCWQNGEKVMPIGQWVCMEWEFNGPADTMNFWLDGAAVGDISVVGSGQGCIDAGTDGKWYAPTFDTMRLGWEHYQDTIVHELWIDDVALDDARIGCG
jgi:hypothetical protein